MVKDIRTIEEGDPCQSVVVPVKTWNRVGIFKLGTKYLKALDCVYLDEREGKPNGYGMLRNWNKQKHGSGN